MHRIPRTRIRAKKKKERRQKKRMIMHAPFIENVDQFFPSIHSSVAESTSPKLVVFVRRFFLSIRRGSGLHCDYTTSARRFIAIIYNRYTFIILVRRHTHTNGPFIP